VKSDNKSLDNNNKKLSNQQPNIDDKKNKKKIKHWEPLDCRECIKPNKFNAFLEKHKNTQKN
jgi:hypothetical protein